MKLICKILLSVLLCFAASESRAQGTAFTYQGRLNDNGAAANGAFDLRFRLFDALDNGNTVSGSVTNFTTPVTNGLFTVLLDFTNAFNGSPRWLEIGVRTNGPFDDFTVLSPRQALTPTPYAIFAGGASNAVIATTISGSVPSAGLAGNYTNAVNLTSVSNTYFGTYSGNGIGLTNVPGGFLLWRIFNSANLQALNNTGYILTNSFLTTITLPSASNVSDGVRFVQSGTGSWKMLPRTNQSIFVGTLGGLVGSNWTPTETSRNWISIASSADGTKLAAAVNGGNIYTSIDSGSTWVAHPGTPGNQFWTSIATSSDGGKIAAVANNGSAIWVSLNGGDTWTSRASLLDWQCIAMSSDGSKLVAGVNTGFMWTSTNYGTNWTQRDSSRNWYSVASSSDGSKLAAVVSSGLIYTSTNSGVNWTSRTIGNQNWHSIASSSDGTKLAAAIYNGKIQNSSDSGITWVTNAFTAKWASIAMSSDGSRLVGGIESSNIFVSGDFGATWTTRSPSKVWWSVTSSSDGSKLAAVDVGGQIYLSTPTFNTSTTNYLSGTQGSAIELLSVGNGQWIPVSSMGSIFAY